MLAIVRGKKGGTRALTKGRKSRTTLYTMRSSNSGKTMMFPIHAVVTYWKGRQGKNKAVTYLFASSPQHPLLNRMLEEYRLRFGIESSYRLMSESRVCTSTRDPKLRILYVRREEMDEPLDKETRTWKEDGLRGHPPLSEVPGHAPVHPREEVRVHTGRGSAREEIARRLGGDVITNY